MTYEVAGYIVGALAVAGLLYSVFFVDWSPKFDTTERVDSNEERLAALGRVVNYSRRLRDGDV